LGDKYCEFGSKQQQKREAGCRRRAEEAHGGRAMFTGETEWLARQASHSIEVRAVKSMADNTAQNLLPLRNDLHFMRDNPDKDTGLYPIEIHVHERGLVIKVNTTDKAYAWLDGCVETLANSKVSMLEVQKRVIIGNIARGIKQSIPPWFTRWQHENGIFGGATTKARPRKKKEEPLLLPFMEME
jgi:hypothetical protein